MVVLLLLTALPSAAAAACCLLRVMSSLSYGLEDLDISNNEGLTGFLPPQIALAPLRSVRATGTDLSCAGIIRPYVSAVCVWAAAVRGRGGAD